MLRPSWKIDVPGKPIVIGTRASELALVQTNEVMSLLQLVFPEAEFQMSKVATHGDIRSSDPIVNLGIGAFVKELETALLQGKIDAAVHSLKDVPTSQPDGLVVNTIARREDPRDALVNRWDAPLDKLPAGARIGTGSPRRAAQLRHLRPDLKVSPVRGNVTTRLSKARGQDLDGVIVALAGLRRLGQEKAAAQVFPPDVMLPAPGQGALAMETRLEDDNLAAMMRAVQDSATDISVRAERALLALLGAGCRAPFGAYAFVNGDTLTLTAMLADEKGSQLYRVTALGDTAGPDAVAQEAHRKLMEAGASSLVGPSGGV